MVSEGGLDLIIIPYNLKVIPNSYKVAYYRD